MNNKISKNIIIIGAIITVLIIVIIISLLMLLNSKNHNTENTYNTANYNEEYVVDANNKKRPEKKVSELVEENKYNTFTIQAVTEEKLLSKYLEDYKYNAINHIEDAYNLLDKEYKEKRFGNIQEYEKYLNSRQEIMENMQLNKYQINKYDTYEQYICLDQYENYYIFNKLPNMSYTVILDTYTIDLPQFTEKYNDSNDGEKAGLNIEKFIESINQKDFEYAYNVLDDSFKINNNMSSLNDFENYVKNNFFERNKVGHISAERDNNYIIYKAKIIDKSLDKESKMLNVIMQLKEDTDFVMSFSFE